ncbi:hypothetical protein Moror_17663 [Moniliophthora roreri MCA 2997]|uniref:Uncharacterized protein n=2 Tax=Moniliophthora roreri TaxID=221103 RepID=V2Z0I1_MONRO|nr:hypothetical protein Moror_17663 [Moniliophthora roreri MCA 2997]KAI3596741.1 hypothetical protein WG66_016318 [Moniliophthora roreri]
MSTAPPSNRASLLSGLRTGGVRSASASIPHTAAPGATFNIPRSISHSFPEEEEDDQFLELPSRNIYANNHHGASHIMPMTAAVDAPNNRFSHHQQQRGMNPNSLPFSPAFNLNTNLNSAQAQQQAFQMQMMQLEILKIQAAQQYQAELMAQAQRQQQQQQNRRASMGFNPPATAGPLTTGFDIQSATLSAQMRRATEHQQAYQAHLGASSDDHVPMTAALGGKFGSRTNFPNRFDDNGDVPPSHGSTTTVISGGTSLGNLNSNNVNIAPSKSDSVSSWRRGGSKGNSVLNGANRAVTSPSVRVTPPEPERSSPPPVVSPTTTKARPQPLRFTPVTSQPLPTVTIDSSDGNDNDDTSSTSSSKSGAQSSPTTPQSSSSNEMPLSPREEASKKLYEGLGMGRPGSAVAQQPAPSDNAVALVSHRMVSQPTRQPRGPPSGADELGPKNFATRIRRKAIGGLGMLMGARERREFVEAY